MRVAKQREQVAWEIFLKRWLDQVVPFDGIELQEALLLGGAFTCVDDLKNTRQVNNVLRFIESPLLHVEIRDKFERYLWLTALALWVEPVRSVLKLWYEEAEPDSFYALQEYIGG